MSLLPSDRPAMRPAHVLFEGVSKSYGSVRAVRGLDLSVERGEFLTLLGPSGSGKTTALMLLAGFETPDAGRIFLDGARIDRLPANRRNIGLVFQNYALFPHMTVAENLAYPLKVRRIGRAEREARILKALDLVRLGGLGGRRPDQLSGGQQQRVAVARALIFEPSLVLMDEPLGALDKHLREQMQAELKAIHARLGVTFLYVTHDQAEALTLSDRIAVFAEGRVQQIAAPRVLYEAPATGFVAGFIGESNRLAGQIERLEEGIAWLRLASGELVPAMAAPGLAAPNLAAPNAVAPAEVAQAEAVRAETVRPEAALAAGAPAVTAPIAATPDLTAAGLQLGASAWISVRPERVRICAAPAPEAGEVRLQGRVRQLAYGGDHLRLTAELGGGQELVVKLPLGSAAPESGDGAILPALGAPVTLGWQVASGRAFAVEA